MNINITVNGEPLEVESNTTVRELLDQLNITAKAIAVEINQCVEPTENLETKEVKEGDWLEIVTLVGGG